MVLSVCRSKATVTWKRITLMSPRVRRKRRTKMKRNMTITQRRERSRRGRGLGLETKVRRLITTRTLTHRRPLGQRQRCFDADGTATVGRWRRRRVADRRSRGGVQGLRT